MYYLYNKILENNRRRLTRIREISLFGCNSGIIPSILRLGKYDEANKQHDWHIEVEKSLEGIGMPNCTIVIDLKSKQRDTNVSLYELVDVWGYSYEDWSPILLLLYGLEVDARPNDVNPVDFIVDPKGYDVPIYEFLYLNGGIAGGKLAGKWIPPPSSPTNAALLWPETLGYFIKCIRQRTPDVLGKF